MQKLIEYLKSFDILIPEKNDYPLKILIKCKSPLLWPDRNQISSQPIKKNPIKNLWILVLLKRDFMSSKWSYISENIKQPKTRPFITNQYRDQQVMEIVKIHPQDINSRPKTKRLLKVYDKAVPGKKSRLFLGNLCRSHSVESHFNLTAIDASSVHQILG